MASEGPAPTDGTPARGQDVRDALLASAAWLEAQAERVNALNVFPVPDGDTGTNMSLTLGAAAEALRRLPDSASVGEVARTAYQAAMMGARGNSGVILSQLLRGFAHTLEGKQVLVPVDLAAALASASEVAYRGVGKPVEGTILTVSRLAAEAAQTAAGLGRDLRGLLEHTLRAAGDAVANTPNQLDVLRRAGVVDSGGEGYRVVLEGAWMWSTGRSVQQAAASGPPAPHPRALLDALGPHEESPFGFCTEFLLQGCSLPLSEVKTAMEALGESVIAVGDDELLRVHVHTLRPGQALEFAVDHGTLAKVKIENMQLQHQAFAAATATATATTNGTAAGAGEAAATGTIGVIAVAPGEGFRKVFESMGARVVEGGQTMNPSVQEILAAVNSSGYQQLILLPNNKNVILTAKHVRELTTHQVEVIETRTAPQGIGALLAFNFQADLPGNLAAMARAAESVHSVEVTRAVRDAEVDGGRPVRAGQLMGLYDGSVVAVEDTPVAAALAALVHASTDALELLTIYYGQDSSLGEAETLAATIREQHPGLEAQVVDGGQPHYPFVLSLE